MRWKLGLKFNNSKIQKISELVATNQKSKIKNQK